MRKLRNIGDEPHLSGIVMERSRTALLIVSLVVCSGAAGSALGAKLLLQPTRHFRVSPLVSAAMKPAGVMADQRAGEPGLQTSVALNALNIEQIIKQNQVSIDDRQAIHALISADAATEVNHYNILNDRLNVDDARVMTIGWILGVLFTLSQAIVVFFHLDRRRTLNRQIQPGFSQQYAEPAPVPFQGTIQVPIAAIPPSAPVNRVTAAKPGARQRKIAAKP